MDFSTALQVAGQFGVVGPVIAYLIWRESNDRRDRRDETDSRLKLATALAALTAAMTGRPHV
jgi:hypothetical protein